jgi:hypothetical protein
MTFHLEPLAFSSLFPSIPKLVHLFPHDQFPARVSKLMNKNYYMKVTKKYYKINLKFKHAGMHDRTHTYNQGDNNIFEVYQELMIRSICEDMITPNARMIIC